MKTKKIILLLTLMLIGMVGFGQQYQIMKYNNSVNTKYYFKCTYTSGGTTYNSQIVEIQPNSSGILHVNHPNPILISFDLKTANCYGNWVHFTYGNSVEETIGSCNNCPNNSAIVGYDGVAWFGIKCKE